MKKLFFIALVSAFAVLSKPVLAQNTLVKVNLLAPLASTGSFYVERVIDDSKSFQLGAFFTKYEEISGYGITPEFRFYLGDSPAPEGFYAAPFLSFMSFKIEGESFSTYKATSTNFGGGLVAGKQWIFKDRFSFDTFIGPEYIKGNVKVTSGDPDDAAAANLDGWMPRAGITLGMRF